jgi:hypothetical protein
MWLGSWWAIARVANGWRVGSWRLWCRVAAGVVEVVGRIGYVAVVVGHGGDTIEWQRWWRDMGVWWRWRWWGWVGIGIGIGLMLPLAQHWLLLLLMKDVNSIL